MDYVRSLNPPVIPYNDANEDQNVKLEDILKYEYMDDLSLDNWVYDGHSIDDIPNYRDVEPPLKDMWALRFVRASLLIRYPNHVAQFGTLARLFL